MANGVTMNSHPPYRPDRGDTDTHRHHRNEDARRAERVRAVESFIREGVIAWRSARSRFEGSTDSVAISR